MADINKERETYSFSISYLNASDVAMNNYIVEKLKQGVKISPYVRSLIEKDMSANGITLTDSNENGFINKNDNSNLNDKIDKIYSMLMNLSNSNSNGYDKLVALEFMMKNATGYSVPATAPIQNSYNDSLLVDKLNDIVALVNNNKNTDIDLSSVNDMMEVYNDRILSKISDIEAAVSDVSLSSSSKDLIRVNNSLSKLTDKISEQEETIQSLLEVITTQNNLIKSLSLTSKSNFNVDESPMTIVDIVDSSVEAKKKAKKMKKAEF